MWVDADDMIVGEEIRNLDGTYGTVTAIEIVQAQQWMYNLTVDEAHTFFVGDGWLVHNLNCINASDLFDEASENNGITKEEVENYNNSQNCDVCAGVAGLSPELSGQPRALVTITMDDFTHTVLEVEGPDGNSYIIDKARSGAAARAKAFGPQAVRGVSGMPYDEYMAGMRTLAQTHFDIDSVSLPSTQGVIGKALIALGK